jgi:transposase InsO family protein
MGISEQTFFRWEKKYGGLGVSELRRLRQLEEENRQLNEEGLHLWFLSMEDAQEKVEKWRLDDNEFRPHGSLGDLTPRQFIDKYKTSIRSQKTPVLAGSVFG